MLEKAGVDPEARPSQDNKLSSNEATNSHVIGGYRATLSNPKSSEEARAHAKEMLDLAGVDANERADPNASDRKNYSDEEKHRHHVEGGYKATLANEKSSKEAREHAQSMLDKLAKGEKIPESEYAKYKNESSDEKHDNHVIGGYKATLSNANSSEEAKKHAREMLEKAGVSYEEGESSDKRGLKRSQEDVESEDKESTGKGKQGFASMPKEKVQEIASKGGRTQHAGEEPSEKKSDSEAPSKKAKTDDSEKSESGKGKQGFASMPKEKVQEIASKGGRTQHAGEEPSEKKSESESPSKKSKTDDSDKSGKGKQGFASMPKEKVQEIASKGGRTQHAGEEPSAVKQQ